MTTPARILRAQAQDIAPALFRRTPAQAARHENILAVGQALMARHGRHHILFTRFALALNLDPSTLRRDIIDLDAMLGEILRRHLHALSRALGQVPSDDPERQRKRRAAYLAYTRTPNGALTPPHLLLVRDCRLLPPDVRLPIEELRADIGRALAGDLGEEAMSLLDTPGLDAARAEFIFAHYSPQKPAPAAPTPLKGERGNQRQNPVPPRIPQTDSKNIFVDAAFVAANYRDITPAPGFQLDMPPAPRLNETALNEAAARLFHQTPPPRPARRRPHVPA